MKKLIFLFAMVLAVSFAMAQNEAFIKQVAPTESGATVAIAQYGDANLIAGPASVIDVYDNTKAAALQISNKGTTSFDFKQFGTGNEGLVRQESWESGAGYQAVMNWKQNGDGNLMMLNQKAKFYTTVEGLQQGNENVFAGLGNVNKNGGMSVDDTKYAKQISDYADARIEFEQIGDNNSVGLTQDNFNGDATLKLSQVGNDNTFVGYQKAIGTGFSYMKVTQTGDDYFAECYQNNTAGLGNNFVVVQ